MENYSYTSYPDSGDSSPRSREIDFENPPPWEDQPPSNYKVKFMCSYGGKIHPRPHDNQLSYIGGETKILAVDRSMKFSTIIAKLSALCETDVSFKYQLPGEELDALISVTNDDDLEHMMHEYDRLFRASAKPARLRLFLFSVNPPVPGTEFPDAKSDRERFMDALNSGPAQQIDPASLPAGGPPNNVDFLFGLDKGVPPPTAVKLRDPAPEPVVPEPEMRVGPRPGEDRVIGQDPNMTPADIQRHIQDLQRLQIQDQAVYRRKNEENMTGAYAGDYYVQKLPEKAPPSNIPVTVPATMPVPSAYWPEKHGGGFPASGDQAVYMFQGPAGVYHAPAPVGRQVTGQASQQYYPVQRMSNEVYREQQMYNMVTQPAAPQTMPAGPQAKMAGYSEGVGMMRQVGVSDGGYAQVAYDGRQMYYTAPGGVVPSYPAMAAMSAEMRPSGALNQEGKGVAKVSQT
ncbi:uncharacterized protein LOC131164079 [Malania oleifera]|uniref:uncharacterized protein LOC131164079 n=1 Tax=Malania oleifera TaxID=397392 RepID=UPI0025AE0F17|nr:uncharacterized protein LOC131164079 [Malania oleifera]